ncbi:MAG: hypothetical protein IJ520_06205 [Synergistaceae bacterium]|nr:hypothetical protein [Synergistaceae bacterium]
MSKFHGKSYLYKAKEIGVTKGLGSEYIIAYYSQAGGKHRVRNYIRLGVYGTADEAQWALDSFAAEQGLTEVDYA